MTTSTHTMSVREKIARRVAERNSWSTYSTKKLKDGLKLLYHHGDKFICQKGIPSQKWLDEHFPIKDVDWDLIRQPKSPKIIQSTWVGHATLFVQMGNFNILTDPIFSERCSAVQWTGPKRYRKPAFTIEELMLEQKLEVDAVLISHNHYDHLDYNSVKKLAEYATRTNHPIEFIVPLGLLSWFEKYVPASLAGGNKVTELDWHESYEVGKSSKDTSLKVTPVPMQHWSSRRGFDRDTTLWCGYSVNVSNHKGMKKDDGANFLFTGDTGMFDCAEDIGSTYGPFDLAAIPIGAYEPRWFMKEEHMNPQDAIDFMDKVQAKMATPIHWGTFQLTVEPVLEPKEKLLEALKNAGKAQSSFPLSLLGETIICE